jgi:hypothetical protein
MPIAALPFAIVGAMLSLTSHPRLWAMTAVFTAAFAASVALPDWSWLALALTFPASHASALLSIRLLRERSLRRSAKQLAIR